MRNCILLFSSMAKRYLFLFPLAALIIFLHSEIVRSQSQIYYSGKDREDQNELFDGCTTITAGKSATADGSVFTSHTCDSHRDRCWMDIIPSKTHPEGSTVTMFKIEKCDSFAMPTVRDIPIGEIPQVKKTYGYINTTLPCINEHQLSIGESTIYARKSLQSDKGIIDLYRLHKLILERCTTAREAIKLTGDLTQKYGWIDRGECLTIADKNEVWHLEIVGAGKGNIGSIWAAQRVPDYHVSVNANASRIRQIDLSNPDYFMASDNIFSVAQDSGWWNPEDGAFEFCYAYDPNGRHKMSSRRREWRVFDLLAPSLKLNPTSENFPFSIKPDTLVTLEKLVRIFQDYYEGTEFNMVKNITWVNENGETEISPLANPFMPYDMNPLFKINGGWGWRGERTIARWYTVYATIIQTRGWLPDEIGGVVWLAWDNAATSIYTPLYCSISDVAESFKTPARIKGYSRESAWWAFNRLGTLAAQRWGDMRKDVNNVWRPLQKKLFDSQKEIDEQALKLYKKDPALAKKYLQEYSMKWCETTVKKAWELGDFLWTKYDEKF